VAKAHHRAARPRFIADAAAHDMKLRGMRSACVAVPLGWTRSIGFAACSSCAPDPVVPVPVALLSAAVPLLAALAWLNLFDREY
jgi:hypothetical protein